MYIHVYAIGVLSLPCIYENITKDLNLYLNISFYCMRMILSSCQKIQMIFNSYSMISVDIVKAGI